MFMILLCLIYIEASAVSFAYIIDGSCNAQQNERVNAGALEAIAIADTAVRRANQPFKLGTIVGDLVTTESLRATYRMIGGLCIRFHRLTCKFQVAFSHTKANLCIAYQLLFREFQTPQTQPGQVLSEITVAIVILFKSIKIPGRIETLTIVVHR
jgi:hypothetical protein